MGSSLFKIETVRLELPRLGRAFPGLRLAQISDIHIGGWMNRERFKHVSDLIVAERPNVLVITGDFVVGHRAVDLTQAALDDLTAGLSRLADLFPTFAVLGNHDYWTDATVIRDLLAKSGVIDLTNKVFTITRGAQNVHLCGIDDVMNGDPRLEDVLAQLPDTGAAILLVHEPDFADISAATGRFDLQVSGHTHGGQVVLPLIGPPVLPRWGRKYPSGLYKIGEMFQYTNRGIGTGRLSIRISCPPEITIFVLEPTPS